MAVPTFPAKQYPQSFLSSADIVICLRFTKSHEDRNTSSSTLIKIDVDLALVEFKQYITAPARRQIFSKNLSPFDVLENKGHDKD